MKKVKTKVRRFFIPIFCILFIIYSIVCGLPNGWFFWALVALVLDYMVNPVYYEVTTTEEAI